MSHGHVVLAQCGRESRSLGALDNGHAHSTDLSRAPLEIPYNHPVEWASDVWLGNTALDRPKPEPNP